jgi:hypothetical protein
LFPFKCTFLHLVIFIVFHTIFKIKSSSKKYLLKNGSIYPFHKFQEIPPSLHTLIQGPFLFCSFFHSKFYFLESFISNSSCCKWEPCSIKFGADFTCYHISSEVLQFSVLHWRLDLVVCLHLLSFCVIHKTAVSILDALGYNFLFQ